MSKEINEKHFTSPSDCGFCDEWEKLVEKGKIK